MVAYIFQAELLCEKCACNTMNRLKKGKLLKDVDTGCSQEFPQGPLADGGGEADSPQHCASCGVFLENPLTEDGMEYVREKVREHGAKVMNIWAPFYGVTDEDAARSAKQGDRILPAIVDTLEDGDFPTCEQCGHNLPIHFTGMVQACEGCEEEAAVEEARREAEEERGRHCAFIGCSKVPVDTWDGVYFCGEHMDAQEEAHNARVSEENRAHDEEEFRRQSERFESIAQGLRECYPSTIPEEWTR